MQLNVLSFKSAISVLMLLMILTLKVQVEAKDLGTYGPVFEISEKNLLDQIMEKLQEAQSSGAMEALQKDIQNKMTQRFYYSLKRDEAPRATNYKSWTYDPSVMVSEDLKDHRGKVFAKKGTRINPLDQVSFGEDMILINGEDPEQVEWAQSQVGKIILVRGQPIKLEEKILKPIYFDQQGVLRKKFNLQVFPVRISQKNQNEKFLFIEEIVDLTVDIKNPVIESDEDYS